MTAALIEALKILLPLLVGGGAVGTWTALRKDRRDSTTHELDVIRIMRADVATASVEATQAAVRAGQAEQRAADAERAAHAQATEIRSLRSSLQRIAGAMAREMTHILDWIDRGAHPPPPAREARIVREALADISTLDPDQN